MKRFLLCLAAAVLPSAAGDRPAAMAPVALYTQFQQEPSPSTREALQSELETIMNPTGLHFEWRSLSDAQSAVATELVVVTFRGRCDVEDLQPLSSISGALGWTHVSDGIVLPFSNVDCSAIRSFLQKELLNRPEDDRERIYGHALGRVLAHELYHVLAGTPNHGSCGIAKSGFTVAELVANEFVFETAELRRLVESKAHRLLQRVAAVPPSTHAP